jgi:serralysin
LTDIPGDSSTTSTLTVGGTATDSLEAAGDHDWIKITLTAGQAVIVAVNGITLEDPYLNIRDSSGNPLYSNDDIVDGVNRNSQVAFNPSYTGTYYIDVGGFNDAYAGTYQVSVQPYTPPPLGTNDQIANQLTSGFWGGDAHHFNVTQGGTITVDISTLNATEQTLARAALAEWSDIIGVHFQEVTSGGQIVFDHSEGSDGMIAATDANWSHGIITSAHVQISSSWVTNYGTSLNSYSFQTYVHEIGHALGLGHSGDYNETATYPYNALFANDSWATSIMSYFSQHDSTYFAAQGFSEDYAVTPMVSDILAMQTLYGVSTTTRTGNTTYGFNANAGSVYNASLYPTVAYTIFDNGGTDTLDFSGSSYAQLLNLNPETYSNVNGEIGNLSIARGTIIENAIGGSGDDTIVGNAANNALNGGAGTDTVSYATATAGVHVDLRLTTAQDTGGAGADTLSGFEKLIGSAFADVLIGDALTISLTGGAGNDLIEAGTATGSSGLGMYGGDGDDTFMPGVTGDEWIDGGAGFNIIDFSSATAGVLITTSGRISTSPYMVQNVHEIIGSSYGDSLYAFNADVLIGGGGNDTLTSLTGQAQLQGGTGNDTYVVSATTDQITENPAEGIDTVAAACNYALGANLENLALHEYLPWDPYAGAAYIPPPSENWSAAGNDLANVITGNLGSNMLSGLGGNDTLTGGGGTDTLTGGAGIDTFIETAAGLSGDTITDLASGEKIVITDATLASFSWSLSGSLLTYAGGSATLQGISGGNFQVAAHVGGGVELTFVRAPNNDFNGDGYSDIILRNDNGQVTDWLGSANGALVSNSAVFSVNPGTDWHVEGTGDFNGDGLGDVLWRNDSGAVVNFLGAPNGSFIGNVNFNLNPGLDWHIEGTGDFNGDGRDDILWRSDNGTVVDLLGNANGSFTGNVNFNLNPGLDWHIDGTGDFNGDGNDDILWRNDLGNVVDLLGNANGSFTGNVNFNLNPGLDWHIEGTGDFNGDGYDDILWRSDNGTVTDLLGQPNGAFVGNIANFSANPGLDWHVQPEHSLF